MRNPEGARFLFRMAKAARKHWAGLAVVTQDAEDVLGSDLGRAVIANAATQVLLRQAPQAIDLAAEAFRLSDGEKAAAAVRPPGRGPSCVRAVRAGVVPGPRLPRRALPVHQRPGRAGRPDAARYPGPGQNPEPPGDDLPGGYPGQGSDPEEDGLL